MADKKPKYAGTRQLKSKSIIGSKVKFNHYPVEENPLTEIRIGALLSENAKADLQAAVDEVLHYHGY